MKTIDKLIKESETLMDKVYSIALLEVERIARAEMKKHPKEIDEFIMAMGSYFFCYKNEISHSFQSEELDNYILKCIKRELKLTGCPIGFIKNGPLITDW